MVEVSLTQGQVALIDDEDAARVLGYKWRAMRCHDTGRYYAVCGAGSTAVFLHRLILNAPPDKQVDHVNRDGLDNRRLNLRLATPSQNQWNSGRRADNRTGFKGVSFDPYHRKFRALIHKHGVKLHLGCFSTAIEAARAYDVAALALYGDFARINFPEEFEFIRRVWARLDAARTK